VYKRQLAIGVMTASIYTPRIRYMADPTG